MFLGSKYRILGGGPGCLGFVFWNLYILQTPWKNPTKIIWTKQIRLFKNYWGPIHVGKTEYIHFFDLYRPTKNITIHDGWNQSFGTKKTANFFVGDEPGNGTIAAMLAQKNVHDRLYSGGRRFLLHKNDMKGIHLLDVPGVYFKYSPEN